MDIENYGALVLVAPPDTTPGPTTALRYKIGMAVPPIKDTRELSGGHWFAHPLIRGFSRRRWAFGPMRYALAFETSGPIRRKRNAVEYLVSHREHVIPARDVERAACRQQAASSCAKPTTVSSLPTATSTGA